LSLDFSATKEHERNTKEKTKGSKKRRKSGNISTKIAHLKPKNGS
jgi:hypothetical protein